MHSNLEVERVRPNKTTQKGKRKPEILRHGRPTVEDGTPPFLQTLFRTTKKEILSLFYFILPRFIFVGQTSDRFVRPARRRPQQVTERRDPRASLLDRALRRWLFS